MRRAGTLAVAITLAAAMTAAPGFAMSGHYRADMTGEEEVPGPGQAGGRGTADIVLDHQAGTLCYTLTYSGIDKPTAAHVHEGAKGVAGPVVVDFELAKNGDKGCVPVDEAELKDIEKQPANHYVNVHNSAYPKGAIRGQLGPG
jgi:hypothetical protein